MVIKMKKGFTLVELIGIIAIIGIVALIAYPSVNNSIKNSRKESCNQIVRTILDASYKYGINNDIGTPSIIEEKKITLETLIKKGYLKDTDYINPVTNEPMPLEVSYYWDFNYNQYVYTYGNGICES